MRYQGVGWIELAQNMIKCWVFVNSGFSNFYKKQ